MTASIQPFAFGQNTIRTLTTDDAIWFVAPDVAEALGYRNAPDAARHLDDDEKGTQIVRTPGGDQRVTIINESGLYALVLRSRKPEARKFAKWVTSEVLPSIRKTGGYQAPTTITPAQQQHLKELVDLVAESGRQTHGETWARLHRKFGVPRYTDLPAGEFDAACQYLRGKLDAPSIATLVQKHLPDAAPPSIKGRRWLVSFDHLGNEQHLALDWNDCVIKYADMPGLIESGAIFDADLIARIGQACLARLLEKQQASALAAQHLRQQARPALPA
ncbi:MAG: Bro-N domain-containing protein [Pseudomonadota bacterium]|nr:Bro-N domain-containing protein [Pseudomonadota bacterium]